MIKRACMAGLALCATTNLMAEPYLGGSIGTVDYGADDISTFEDSTGFEIIIGNKFNKNFAFEASYVDFGEASDNIPPAFRLDGDTLAFGALAIAEVDPKLDVFFKLGLHMWDVSLSADGFGTLATDDGTDVMFGIGATYKPSYDLGFGARFNSYDLDGDDATMLSVYLQASF